MTLSCIPVPDQDALVTAQRFIDAAKDMSPADRDAYTVGVLLLGNVPSHMREFVDVSVTFVDKAKATRELTLRVLPDGLCVGDDVHWLRTPMSPLMAQRVCDAWDCMLPTPKIVKLIWAAGQKLAPQPWGPPYDHSMLSLERMVDHNARINAQIAEKELDQRGLLSGHKKDVVLTNRLLAQPKQVAIFGWVQLNGKEIQPLSLVHEAQYADYSHLIRLVSKVCVLDGTEVQLESVLSDPNLASAVSLEGPLKVFRQPGTGI